jgi:type I restriction enzyme S subunit
LGGRGLIEDRDDFSKLPRGWILTNLETIATVVTGKTPSTSIDNYWNGEIPFVTPSEIAPEGSILPSRRTLTLLGAKQARILPQNSILIVCIGTVGKVGILSQASVINQQINALVVLDFIYPKFIYYWSKYFIRPWVIANASATVNAAILNKSRLGTAPALLPPLNEQRRIVAKMRR